MRSKIKNDDGFGFVVVIAVLAVILVLCFVGWLVYKTGKTNTSSTGNVISQKNDRYKTLALNAEKLELQYPSNWLVQNRSTATCDEVNLRDKTTNLYLKINTCASITSSESSSGYFKAHYPESIHTLGKEYYLGYSMMFDDQTVQAATVSTSPDTVSQYPPSQHAVVEEGFLGPPGISISIIYGVTSPDEIPDKTLAEFKGTTSFIKAIKVIESLTYQ